MRMSMGYFIYILHLYSIYTCTTYTGDEGRVAVVSVRAHYDSDRHRSRAAHAPRGGAHRSSGLEPSELSTVITMAYCVGRI